MSNNMVYKHSMVKIKGLYIEETFYFECRLIYINRTFKIDIKISLNYLIYKGFEVDNLKKYILRLEKKH